MTTPRLYSVFLDPMSAANAPVGCIFTNSDQNNQLYIKDFSGNVVAVNCSVTIPLNCLVTIPSLSPVSVPIAVAPTPVVSSPPTTSTPTPTPIPAPVPMTPVVGAISGLPQNPYAPTSTWNQLLPTSPTLNANSSAMISGLFNQPYAHYNKFVVNGPGGIAPVFMTSSTDPTVVIAEQYGNLQGATVPMPVAAAPAGGTDAHLEILNPTNGNEYGYYQFPKVAITQGETINVTAGCLSNYFTGTGWDGGVGSTLTSGNGGIVTSSGATMMAGAVTLDEFMSGTIKHKVSLSVGGNNGAPGVWPATAAAKYNCPTTTTPGIGPGSLIWSDLTDAQVDALGWDKISSMILKALHNYGGFVTDQNGFVPMDIRQLMVGPASAATQGQTWWSANGGNVLNLQTQSIAWYSQHLHVVDATWFQTFSNNQR